MYSINFCNFVQTVFYSRENCQKKNVVDGTNLACFSKCFRLVIDSSNTACSSTGHTLSQHMSSISVVCSKGADTRGHKSKQDKRSRGGFSVQLRFKAGEFLRRRLSLQLWLPALCAGSALTSFVFLKIKILCGITDTFFRFRNRFRLFSLILTTTSTRQHLSIWFSSRIGVNVLSQ